MDSFMGATKAVLDSHHQSQKGIHDIHWKDARPRKSGVGNLNII